MVQYVFTPWKDRQELLHVRREFYRRRKDLSSVDGDAAAFTRADRQRAVSRVSMWMQRGGCPHMVESTALLVAAMLADEESCATAAVATNSSYAVRSAYSAAFSRFVTGLLDSHQDRSHKMSMYSVAKTIGLPATFVELRHQATHEQLPSLTRLRAGAQAGLVWIWDYYWKQLAAVDDDDDDHDDEDDDQAGSQGMQHDGDKKVTATTIAPVVASGDDACKDGLLRVLQDDSDGEASHELVQLVARWGTVPVLRVLDAIGDEAGASSPINTKLVMGTLRLARHVATLQPVEGAGGGLAQDLEQTRQEAAAAGCVGGSRDSEAMPPNVHELGAGWSRPEGPWLPKPIGTV